MSSTRKHHGGPRLTASPIEVAAPEARGASLRLADLRRAFDLCLTGAPVDEVLRQILEVACAHFPESNRAALFVHQERAGARSQCLRCRVGVRLDAAYISAVEALDIGKDQPSCLSVMYTGQRSLVCDLSRDPLWQPYLGLASEHRIGAVWSFPVRPPGTALHKGPLGTLAVYFESAREPVPGDLEFLELLASSAGLVLDREGAEADRDLAAGEAQALRAAQEQLRRNHETFYSLIQNAPFGVYVIDADFRIVQASAGAQRVFSNVHPLLGHDFSAALRTVWPEPFATQALDRFRHTLDTGESYRAESVERRGDIEETESYDWRIERVTLPDGRYGVVCYFYDLTEKRLLEAQLRESSDRYRAAFELAHVGQMQLDPATGRFLMVNNAYCTITGRTREQLLTLSVWDVIHPLDLPEFGPRLLSYFRGDTSTYSAEKRYLRPDGRTVWVRVNAALVLGPDGRPDRSVHMVEDITAQREAERALRRSNAELDRFASFASHDLKEPLRGINSLTAFVLEDEATLGPKSRDRLNRIHDLSRQLSAMIDGLLEYARAGGRLNIEPCDLRAIVTSALDKLRESVRRENAKVDIDANLPRIRADCVLLERAIANLINNALKYNNAPTKAVRIGFQDGELFVRDNGDGIDPAQHDRIFGVFVRLDSPAPVRATPRGSGLGLALVKRVIEAHGGSVRVESTPGQGSTFYLRFPPDAVLA
jgi:PAS domain S-box-containing protein